MGRAVTIAVHEYRVTVRRKSFILLTLLFPLLGLAAVGGVRVFQEMTADEEVQEVRWGYVDLANVLDGVQRQDEFVFVPFSGPEEAKRRLLADDLAGYVVLPPDYLQSGRGVAYITERGISPAEGAQAALRRVLVQALLSARVEAEVARRVAAPLGLQPVRLNPDGEPAIASIAEELGRFFFFLGLTVLLMLGIFTSSGFLLQGIGEEKENRIMELLLSAVTARDLLIGKILGLGSAGLTQVVVWGASAILLVRFASSQLPIVAEMSPPLWAVPVGIVLYLLGFLLFATLMAAVGAVTTTMREAQQLSTIFVIPGIVPIYALAFIAENPNSLLAQVLTFFPLTAPFTVMERLGVVAIGPRDVVISALIIALSIPLAMWVAVRIFRAYLLMYGRRPGLRDIARALRA